MATFQHSGYVHCHSHHGALAPQRLGARARHCPIWTLLLNSHLRDLPQKGKVHLRRGQGGFRQEAAAAEDVPLPLHLQLGLLKRGVGQHLHDCEGRRDSFSQRNGPPYRASECCPEPYQRMGESYVHVRRRRQLRWIIQTWILLRGRQLLLHWVGLRRVLSW